MTYTALKKEQGLLLLHLLTICAGGYAENRRKVLHDEREETYIHVSWPSTCTSVNVEHMISVPCIGNCYQHSTDKTKQHQTTWDVVTLRQICNSFCLCSASTNSKYCVHLSEETGYAGMYQPLCGDNSVYSKIHHTYQPCVEALMSLIVFVILLLVSHKIEILRTSNSQSCEGSVISRALCCSNDVLPREIFMVGTVINLNYVTNFTFSCLDICKKTINWGSCNEDSYEFDDGMEKSFKISRLYGITAHHISDQHLFIYPLIATVKSYLSRVQGGSVSQDEEMCYEVRRFQSYNSVPVRASPMRLAQSGFYATGSGDETRCYSCRMTYRGWRLMDQPDQIHRSMTPDCPHLNNTDERNIPVSSSASDSDVTTVRGVIGEYPTRNGSSENVTYQPGAASTSVSETSATSSTSTETPALAGLDISRAVYPQYREVSSRLDSYQGWGWSHVQDPQVLARAGFYYAGYCDCVRCFYCGVGLRNWEREDDPLVEHVRWRSSCDYAHVMRREQNAPRTLQTTGQLQHRSSVLSSSETAEGRTKEASQLAATDAKRFLLQQLQEETESLRHESTCKVCLDNPSCIVFLPCGHLVTCAECAPALRNCPICRALIRGTVRAHTAASSIVTSLMGSAADDSIPASETNQKAVRHGPDSRNTSYNDQEKRRCQDENGNTDRDTDESGDQEVTERLSASQERQLEEENQSLRDESACMICLDNPSCIVFLPCGHLVTCAECAPALRNCPICRALIRGTIVRLEVRQLRGCILQFYLADQLILPNRVSLPA